MSRRASAHPPPPPPPPSKPFWQCWGTGGLSPHSTVLPQNNAVGRDEDPYWSDRHGHATSFRLVPEQGHHSHSSATLLVSTNPVSSASLGEARTTPPLMTPPSPPPSGPEQGYPQHCQTSSPGFDSRRRRQGLQLASRFSANDGPSQAPVKHQDDHFSYWLHGSQQTTTRDFVASITDPGRRKDTRTSSSGGSTQAVPAPCSAPVSSASTGGPRNTPPLVSPPPYPPPSGLLSYVELKTLLEPYLPMPDQELVGMKFNQVRSKGTAEAGIPGSSSNDSEDVSDVHDKSIGARASSLGLQRDSTQAAPSGPVQKHPQQLQTSSSEITKLKAFYEAALRASSDPSWRGPRTTPPLMSPPPDPTSGPVQGHPQQFQDFNASMETCSSPCELFDAQSSSCPDCTELPTVSENIPCSNTIMIDCSDLLRFQERKDAPAAAASGLQEPNALPEAAPLLPGWLTLGRMLDRAVLELLEEFGYPKLAEFVFRRDNAVHAATTQSFRVRGRPLVPVEARGKEHGENSHGGAGEMTPPSSALRSMTGMEKQEKSRQEKSSAKSFGNQDEQSSSTRLEKRSVRMSRSRSRSPLVRWKYHQKGPYP